MKAHAKGASSINPCPYCGHTWFTVVEMLKDEWRVICCGCNKNYVKPLNIAKDSKQLKFDFENDDGHGHH